MNMTEIFQIINTHEVEGMMTHAQLADYFDFLDLHGYKRLHEYHYLDETICHRHICRYFINHFNQLIPPSNSRHPDLIPQAWYMHCRKDIDINTKRKAVATAFDKWVEWEKGTKKLYEKMYKEACAIDEIAAASVIKNLVCDVDNELKYAERMCIALKSVDYDISYIYEEQDMLHDKYKDKIEHLNLTFE